MIFNAEENELLACYMPVDDRLALIKSIVRIRQIWMRISG